MTGGIDAPGSAHSRIRSRLRDLYLHVKGSSHTSPYAKSKGLTRPGYAIQSYIVIVSFTKEDPLLTVGYDCIQNTFLNTCHDMCSVCSKRSPHTSPFLLKLIRLNSLGFAV